MNELEDHTLGADDQQLVAEQLPHSTRAEGLAVESASDALIEYLDYLLS